MKTIFRLLFLDLIFIAAGILSVNSQETENKTVLFKEENNACLKCHGSKTYTFYNENLGKEVKDRMNPYFVIDPGQFYVSNHKTFKCIDCHSMEYDTFPHPGTLRMEQPYACLDCHGGDETYAKFQFERIDEEFQKSVHFKKHNEDYTCWMCHNPHTYKINARNNSNIKQTIAYDNGICLSCHANVDKYQLIVEWANPNIIEKHEWLPNQALHFLNVRCVECHAEIKNDMLVAHNVREKEKAVKLCVECHSQNSLLLASLYRHQVKEKRNTLGFFNASILNNSYIIGANRNYYLNITSLIVFGLVLAGIAFHAILRILNK